jgi:pimeloyl-ACP methyl ester carboxylesterase
MVLARRSFTEQNGTITPRYDPKLARILSGVRMARPLPALWQQFDALAGVPLMVIRGANLDILSAETVSAMGARRSKLIAIEIPEQGHAPLLDDRDTLARIGEFIAMC